MADRELLATYSTVCCNQIETVGKRTLFMTLQLMKEMFKTSSEQIITFAGHKYGRVEVLD